MTFPQILHDGYCPDRIFYLSKFILEFLYVFLDIAEGRVACVSQHPGVVDDVLSLYPLFILDGQKLPDKVLGLLADCSPVVGVKFDAVA
jgi:hypothetical protein